MPLIVSAEPSRSLTNRLRVPFPRIQARPPLPPLPPHFSRPALFLLAWSNPAVELECCYRRVVGDGKVAASFPSWASNTKQRMAGIVSAVPQKASPCRGWLGQAISEEWGSWSCYGSLGFPSSILFHAGSRMHSPARRENQNRTHLQSLAHELFHIHQSAALRTKTLFHG